VLSILLIVAGILAIVLPPIAGLESPSSPVGYLFSVALVISCTDGKPATREA
jgi:drug/metabolite transporter (DMT)-like permease